MGKDEPEIYTTEMRNEEEEIIIDSATDEQYADSMLELRPPFGGLKVSTRLSVTLLF